VWSVAAVRARRVQFDGAKLTEGTLGSAQTLALYENETVGDAVATFCSLYQVPQDSKLSLSKTLSKRVKARAVSGWCERRVGLSNLRSRWPVGHSKSPARTSMLSHLGGAGVLSALSRLELQRVADRCGAGHSQTQKVLLSIPVTAPHGRVRNLTLLQGDQHSLEDVALNFASAMVLPDTAAAQLVEALTQRLPKFAFSVPVAQGEGKPVLNLRVLEGDDPFEVGCSLPWPPALRCDESSSLNPPWPTSTVDFGGCRAGELGVLSGQRPGRGRDDPQAGPRHPGQNAVAGHAGVHQSLPQPKCPAG
jgi:hypothetical protein